MDNLLYLFLYISISLCSVNTSLGYVVHVVILPYEDFIYLFDQVHDFWSLKEDWQIFLQNFYIFWIINFSKYQIVCPCWFCDYWNWWIEFIYFQHILVGDCAYSYGFICRCSFEIH